MESIYNSGDKVFSTIVKVFGTNEPFEIKPWVLSIQPFSGYFNSIYYGDLPNFYRLDENSYDKNKYELIEFQYYTGFCRYYFKEKGVSL